MKNKNFLKIKIKKQVKDNSSVSINVFDLDRVLHLEDYYNKPKFKITKIAGILAFLLVYPVSTFASSINTENIVNLTNNDRQNSNLNTLSIDLNLSKAAQAKADDMISKKYFEHYTPSGQTPWDFMKNSDYNYVYAGENLAMDFQTAEGVNTGWMNSGSHRKNILNSNYQDIGIGISKGDFNGHITTIVVQMFGQKEKSFTVNSFFNQVTKLMGF